MVCAAVLCGCVACGGGRAAIPYALGLSLAAKSDRVIALLKHGDNCGAASEATALQLQASKLTAASGIDGPTVAELRRRTQLLSASILCLPKVTSATPAAAQAPPSQQQLPFPGNSGGHGHGHGHD